MEKLAGDLLLGLKFVKLEILSTSLIDFFGDKLGEFKSRLTVERSGVLQEGFGSHFLQRQNHQFLMLNRIPESFKKNTI